MGKDPAGQQTPQAQPAKAENADEIQFFEGTITKLVERENEDGDKEWVEVMSDNLYPGEKLKRVVDEEKAEEKAKAARKEAKDAKDSQARK